MFLEKYHPKTLKDLYGQKFVQNILRGILSHPESSPRVLIFHGDYGTGKTSATEIFARALNCEKPPRIGSPCGDCPSCVPIGRAPYYRDLDCGLVGNVEATRGIHEDLLYGTSIAKWQVVVFDEFHMASKSSQGALLKPLDSLDPKTFVIFVTTELDRVIPTIRSRGVHIPFNCISDTKARDYVFKIMKKERLDIAPGNVDKIILRAGGHIRDLLKELEMVKIVGDKIFDEYVDYEKLLISALLMVRAGDKEKFEVVLSKICDNPLAYVKLYFYMVLDRGMQHLFLGKSEYVHTKGYDQLRKLWRLDFMELFRYSVSEWGEKSFENEHLFRCFMRSIYLKFSKKG